MEKLYAGTSLVILQSRGIILSFLSGKADRREGISVNAEAHAEVSDHNNNQNCVIQKDLGVIPELHCCLMLLYKNRIFVF